MKNKVQASNQHKCPSCGRKMALVRRVEAPALGPGGEFRLFECANCGYPQTLQSLGEPAQAA